MIKPIKLQWYSDPSHGWLKISVADLERLQIATVISNYSYMSANGRIAYLEEDCDAPIALQRIVELGIPISWRIDHHNRYQQSHVRRLTHYWYQPTNCNMYGLARIN